MKFTYQAKEMKKLRESLQLSQREFADGISYHAQFVSNIERSISGVSKEMLARLAQKGYKTESIRQAMVKDFAECVKNI